MASETTPVRDESTREMVRSFLRSMLWVVPLVVGTVVAMWALDVNGMRDYDFGAVLLIGLGFLFVLGPLVWLRVEHFGRSDRPFWVFFGLALAWIVVSMLILLVLLALVVGD